MVTEYEWLDSTWGFMKKKYMETEDVLHSLLPGRSIDEMSIYFQHVDIMQDMIDAAVQSGVVEHFNTVKDHVRQLPDELIGFDVWFEFLQEEDQDYRVELMKVVKGFSVVHDEMDDGDIPHASFKCTDKADYSMCCLMLQNKGLRQLAEFKNTYGIFSYWADEFALPPFIKPRVKLQED